MLSGLIFYIAIGALNLANDPIYQHMLQDNTKTATKIIIIPGQPRLEIPDPNSHDPNKWPTDPIEPNKWDEPTRKQPPPKDKK